jgi:uncharacterized protein (DUF2126 family)
LIADESQPGKATAATAEDFLRGVAERLGLDKQYIFPAYEDLFYYLWRERRLPANVDPFDSRLEDPLERERLMRVLSQGLKQGVGHVLPVARDLATGQWRSGAWFLRSEHCYLLPGDSPMGYRLPLDSLPWTSANDYPHIFPPDPTQLFPPLATHAQIRFQLGEAKPADGGAKATDQIDRAPAEQESAAWISRTALCAEPRNGVLYIFMPPVSAVEDYLELVAAVEATAEGAPAGIRLNAVRVRGCRNSASPHPGVIRSIFIRRRMG